MLIITILIWINIKNNKVLTNLNKNGSNTIKSLSYKYITKINGRSNNRKLNNIDNLEIISKYPKKILTLLNDYHNLPMIYNIFPKENIVFKITKKFNKNIIVRDILENDLFFNEINILKELYNSKIDNIINIISIYNLKIENKNNIHLILYDYYRFKLVDLTSNFFIKNNFYGRLIMLSNTLNNIHNLNIIVGNIDINSILVFNTNYVNKDLEKIKNDDIYNSNVEFVFSNFSYAFKFINIDKRKFIGNIIFSPVTIFDMINDSFNLEEFKFIERYSLGFLFYLFLNFKKVNKKLDDLNENKELNLKKLCELHNKILIKIKKKCNSINKNIYNTIYDMMDYSKFKK